MKALPRKKQITSVEPLEQRIAPAALVDVVPAVKNTSILLDADPNSATPAGITAGLNGPYLLYVTKGECRVFTQDYNNNGVIDFNEITGISAGEGLRLISFVDIHGDIVTNLNPDGTLTDSDGNASNGRDGQVLLNNHIEKIELRSVTANELSTGQSLSDRIALSSYSIFGNIYAGGGFGASDGGLVIDSSGFAAQQTAYQNSTTISYTTVRPEIGSIRIGTAASGQPFNFGISGGDDVRGVLAPFIPANGAAGGDIINVGSVDPTTMPFNLGTLQAGNGGYNGRGGDIINAVIGGDNAGGYSLIAGDGGNGPNGGRGGNITGWGDFGTTGAEIFVKTGTGGTGFVGKGGNGGILSFVNSATASPVSIAGRVIIKLGDGGSGLTGGGDGGTQPDGEFSSPNPTVPSGVKMVSSWHQPGNIGQLVSIDDNGVQLSPGDAQYHALRGFDFDGDGQNDAVYSSAQIVGGGQGNNSSQLVVLFGSGSGAWNSNKTLYLNGPQTSAITIGDFNNDGHPDIAAASGENSFAGIRVFLSRYDSAGNFVGFSDAIFSPLPSMGQNVIVTGVNAVSTHMASSVYDLASGDFDGDGIIDLAVMGSQRLFIMRGDSDPGPNGAAASPTGYFYSDFGNNGGLLPAAGGGSKFSLLKATSIIDGGQDYVIGTNEGADHFSLYRADALSLSGIPTLGQVDTDRNAAKASFSTATMREVAVTDLDGNGTMDVVALTSEPGPYLIVYQGNGAFGFTKTTGSGDQAGIYLGANGGGLGLNDNSVVGIRALHLDNANNLVSSEARELGVMVYDSDPTAVSIHVGVVSINPATLASANRVASFSTPDPFVVSGDQSVRAFDAYNTSASTTNTKSQTIAFVQSDGNRVHDYVESFPINVVGSFESVENNSWIFTAGNGGASASGPGGKGGVIGKTLTQDPTTGAITGSFNIVLPQSPSFEAVVSLTAGSGGNGFTRGGDGGSIAGLAVSYDVNTTVFTSDVSLLAGNGGDSIRGAGGAGGNLSSFSVTGGIAFVAGQGGDGRTGGRGGSIIGNPFGIDASAGTLPQGNQAAVSKDLVNTEDVQIQAIAGDGGAGIVAGGDGGAISGFTPQFLRSNADLISVGLLFYQAGNGGESVRGAGGRGGAVVDSSPVNADNFLSGDIYIQAGHGGNGKSGGAGGFISDFTDTTTSGISPSSFSLLAGNGGNGVAGKGGAGGGIFRVDVSGTGTSDTRFFPTLGTYIVNGRVVAGMGGNSVGNAGGNGGSIDLVDATATSSSMVAAAGRGGDGLQRGGNGGSVTNSKIESAAPYFDQGTNSVIDLQTLIIAGEGGDAFAGSRRSGDPLAPGGVNPVGGDGGSIINVSQSIGGEVNVQLIAGNGGDLINSGSTTDLKAKVGKGGSIMHVYTAGRIGDAGDPGDENTPIKAYNPLYDGNVANDDMAFFVSNTVLGNPAHLVTGADGNVGIVVGAKGRVRDGNNDGALDPAPDTPGSVANGSLIDVTAQHIMSAVAGNVDRIASIQVLQSVRSTITGGEYGSDKAVWGSPTPPGTAGTSVDGHPFAKGQLDYLTDQGFWVSTPQIGGRLVDGAIVAKNSRPFQSDRDFKLA